MVPTCNLSIWGSGIGGQSKSVTMEGYRERLCLKGERRREGGKRGKPKGIFYFDFVILDLFFLGHRQTTQCVRELLLILSLLLALLLDYNLLPRGHSVRQIMFVSIKRPEKKNIKGDYLVRQSMFP